MLAEALALYNGLFRTIRIERRFDGDAAAGAHRRRADPARGRSTSSTTRSRRSAASAPRRGPTARPRPSSSRRSTTGRTAWRGSSSPTTVPASRRPTATSCSCRTTRPSSGAAASAWPSSAASSSSTAAASKWRTTIRWAPGSSSSCRCEEHGRMKASVLIVDDEAGVRSALSGVLRDEGYQVEAVESGEACLERLTRAAYDVDRARHLAAGLDGLGTLERLRQRSVDAPVVMISGHGNIESAVRAIKMGAFDFVEKPLSLEKTVLVVGNARPPAAARGGEPRAARARRSPPRDGRRELRHAAAARADRDGGADQRPRADLRRERHRQGAGGAQRPRDEPPAQRPVRRGELRGDSRGADRERAVRPREGRLHRRARRIGAASSSWPTAARCSSTRSAT